VAGDDDRRLLESWNCNPTRQDLDVIKLTVPPLLGRLIRRFLAVFKHGLNYGTAPVDIQLWVCLFITCLSRLISRRFNFKNLYLSVGKQTNGFPSQRPFLYLIQLIAISFSDSGREHVAEKHDDIIRASSLYFALDVIAGEKEISIHILP